MIKLCLILFVFTLVESQDLTVGRDLVASIEHVHRINKNAEKYLKNSNQRSAVNDRLIRNGAMEDIRARAEEALVAARENAYEVSSTCLNHTEIFLEALIAGEMWALRMIDAMGKPPSGLLDFNLIWIGSWDECWAIEATVNTSSVTSHPFRGKYCTSAFVLGETSAGQTPFSGPVLTVTLGVCFPGSCSRDDAVGLVQTLESLLPINTTGMLPPIVTCNDLNPTYDTKAIVVLVVCSVFLSIVAIATAYDIFINCCSKTEESELPTKQTYGSFNGHTGNGVLGNGHLVDDRTPLVSNSHTENGDPRNYESKASTIGQRNSLQQEDKYKPGLLGKLLLSFSVYTNAPKTFNTKQPSGILTAVNGLLGKLLLSFSVYTNAPKIFNTKQPSGTLTAINGIRFISMTWVILGHTYAFGIGAIDNAATFIPKVESRLSFQAISNATFAVDTFFVLSGLLVSYLSLKEMKKRGGMKKFKWGMFYFHRFWRLTPPYMLFLMTYVPLAKYLGNGPGYPQATGFDIDECKDTWWTNLLYINNLVHTDKMCMGWSWYLANDMQFYILSPLMLIPLYYSPLWGAISCLGLVLVNFISAGLVSHHYHAGANLLLAAGAGDSFIHLYVKPWTRVGPYAVGFFTGYLLYKTDCKVKMSKIVNALGWLIATALALLILYGLWSSDLKPVLGLEMSALYNATSRTMWGVAISWVVFACATGYGGPVNKLLSWPAVTPLSRLTYCAYLVHPVIMYTYYYSHKTLMHWDDLEVAYIYLGNMCLAYAAAFIISLVYESPMMGLEKVLLGREKRS